MVKGISRQVIVVPSPDPTLFEQAIFILKDSASLKNISGDMLLKQAEKAIHTGCKIEKKHKFYLYSVFWAGVGAFCVGTIWVITAII